MSVSQIKQRRAFTARDSNLLNAQLAHLKASFVYTGSFGSCSEHIHFVGQVVLPDNPFGVLKETVTS